jgi:hypothetical protein
MTQRQVVVEISPGLLLTSDGQFLKDRPSGDISITTFSFDLPLSEGAKAVLHGQTLQVMDKQFGTKVLDGLGISQDFRELATTAAAIAAGVVSVVGWIGAAVKLAEILLGPKPPTQLDVIAKNVADIHNAVVGLAKDSVPRFIAPERAKVQASNDDLKQIILRPNFDPSDVHQLEENLKTVWEAFLTLKGSNIQRAPFDPTEYQDPSRTPWYGGFPNWQLVPVPFFPRLATGVGAGSEQIPPFFQIQPFAPRWDYRLFLPPLIEAAISLLAHFKAIEPIYRTTGTYRDRLSTLRDDLNTFAGNMVSCLQWTRDYMPFQDKYYMPMAYGWPVGAVDTCSGASAFNSRWNEGIVFNPFFKPPPDDPFASPPVSNVDDCLMRASEERSQDFMAVFVQSGIPQLLILIGHINDQIRVPFESETVSMRVRKLGTRSKVGSATRVVQATSVCKARDFTADVYHFPREFLLDFSVQPKFLSKNYRIPYRYYIESYVGDGLMLPELALSRTEIKGGKGQVTLLASCYDWELEDSKLNKMVQGVVAPATALRGLARSVFDPASPVRYYPGLIDQKEVSDWEKMQWGDDPDMPGTATHRRQNTIRLDFAFEAAPDEGHVTVRLTNHPEDGNFDHVFFVIEETPGPPTANLPAIRSVLDIGMVGLEYHLPSDYFAYQRDCLNKAAALLNKIRDLARIGQVSVPRWDPWQFQSVAEYLAVIQTQNPALVESVSNLISSGETVDVGT